MASKWTRLSRTLIGIVVLAGASALLAASPAQTITTRQHDLKAIGGNAKAIFDELKKPTPAVAIIRTNAHAIAVQAPHLASWFPAGTGLMSGVKTKAMPEIWSKPAEFRRAADNMVTKSRELDSAAASGDLDKIKPAAMALGGACKQCHDSFRERE